MSLSTPPDSGGSDQPFSRRAGKAPEKSNFAQTCSFLSQYFKERGALGMATRLEAASKARSEMSPAAPGTEVNLLPNMEKSTETPDLYTKLASPSTSISMEDTESKAEFRIPITQGLRTAPMTIFYAGEVLVYDDFPSDKAREIMALAGKYVRSYSVIGTPGVDKISFTPLVINESDIVHAHRIRGPAQQADDSCNFPVPMPKELAQQQPQANGVVNFLVSPLRDNETSKHREANGFDHVLVPTPKERAPEQSPTIGSNNFLVPTPREPAQQQLQGNGSDHFLVPTLKEQTQQQSQANSSGNFLVPAPREPAQQQSQPNGSGSVKVSITGVEQPSKQQSQSNGSDLPIARRASLHRFLSKRKDRAAAKAPYQVNMPLNSPPPEPGESSNPCPEMESSEGQSSKQHIDLNL